MNLIFLMMVRIHLGIQHAYHKPQILKPVSKKKINKKKTSPSWLEKQGKVIGIHEASAT